MSTAIPQLPEIPPITCPHKPSFLATIPVSSGHVLWCANCGSIRYSTANRWIPPVLLAKIFEKSALSTAISAQAHQLKTAETPVCVSSGNHSPDTNSSGLPTTTKTVISDSKLIHKL
jgi:hypothetical protein